MLTGLDRKTNIREKTHPLGRDMYLKRSDMPSVKSIGLNTGQEKQTDLSNTSHVSLNFVNETYLSKKKKSSTQRQLSSSSDILRAYPVSNEKVNTDIKSKTTTSQHIQGRPSIKTQQRAIESESKSPSSKSSSSLTTSQAKENKKEAKHSESVWSSLLSNFGMSPDRAPSPLPACPEIPPGLLGRISLNLAVLPLDQVAAKLPRLGQGGEGKPMNCSSNHEVAVIVPYRNRPEQLAVFLRNLHPMLIKQQLHYRIYLVNQTDTNAFNRAMLMNVGFVEAMKDHNWTCAIFHDVDLLPEDDRNLYTCPEQPRHLSVAVDKFKYRLPYKGIFGGATAVRADQFR